MLWIGVCLPSGYLADLNRLLEKIIMSLEQEVGSQMATRVWICV